MRNEPHATRRGWLRHGNPPGDLTKAARCGARTKRRTGPCRAPAMANGRCRMHGGKSTGPRTETGLERSRQARLCLGFHTQEMRERRAGARAAFRRMREILSL